MTRTDVVNHWSGTYQFPLISSPRRFRLSEDPASMPLSISARGQRGWDYVEVDNRGNKGATIYYAFNGDTVSSTLASGILTNRQSFRLPPDSIDRIFIRATSISAIATSNATTVFLTMGRY